MHAIFALTMAAVIILNPLLAAQSRTSDTKNEARVACNELIFPEPVTHYGLSKATLVSLWYARNAVRRSSDIQAAMNATSAMSALTSMMTAIKEATNDFVCAKRAVQPFTKADDENSKVAASFLLLIYDEHIGINNKILALLKGAGTSDQMKFADQVSSLQVERGERWSDLVPAVSLVLGQLVDLRPTDSDGNFIPDTKANRDNGKTKRFVITKVQKQALLDWTADHFPEFSDRTPQDQWAPPASAASTYIDFLNDGRKCSDE